MSSAGESKSPHTAESLKGAFQGEFKRRRPGFMYMAWCLICAGASLVLPLIYLGIVLVTAAAIYWHGTASFAMLLWPFEHPLEKLLHVVLYFVPLLVGLIFLIFLIKPILVPHYRMVEPIALTREDEPVLFALVDEIARAVRAPRPRRIVVDLSVNAMAGFTGGPFSFLLRRLELTIGLPLVAGVQQKELAGVIAHELGHFAQGTGMRLQYIVVSINRWFARQVFERDAFDEWLHQNSRDENNSLFALILLFVSGGTWIIRKILFLLLVIGNMITSSLRRQSEFDADSYEYALSGSDTFELTTGKFLSLNIASQLAFRDIAFAMKENRLPDNYPMMVAENVRNIPPEILKEQEEVEQKRKAGWFDSHPTDRERIARARKAAAEGILRLEGPARELFRDFDALCRQETVALYKARFGKSFKPEMVEHSKQVVQRREQVSSVIDAQARYFQEIITPIMPLPLQDPNILQRPENPQKCAQDMMEAREAILSRLDVFQAASRAHGEAFRQVMQASFGLAALDAGFQLEKGTFDLPGSTRQSINEYYRDSSIRMRSEEEVLKPFLQHSARRLLAALQLLHVPKVREHMKEEYVTPERCQFLLENFCRVGWGLDFVRELEKDRAVLSLQFHILNRAGQEESLIRRIQKQFTSCHMHITHIANCFAEDPYPFEHHLDNPTIASYLIPSLPHPMDYNHIMHLTEFVPSTYYTLYYRLLGELSQIAENVEKTLKLKPLPKPAREEAKEVKA